MGNGELDSWKDGGVFFLLFYEQKTLLKEMILHYGVDKCYLFYREIGKQSLTE